MNRFAPGWLPRQQRRRIDRELDKLIQRDVCSLCGAPFKHNTRTAPGLADQLLAGIERRGDGIRASEVNLQDYAWKRDDARWFEQNPGRTHRARVPFPGEIEVEVEPPTGSVPIVLVRQVEPGSRLRIVCDLSTALLPLPDDEAVAHALCEVAMRRDPAPSDSETLDTLIKKYQASGAAS